MSGNADQLDALYAAFDAASDEDKPHALSRLAEGMRKSAWAISFKILKQAMPDAVHDAVTGAIQTLHTFQGKARFSTWFYSVVRVHCMMALIAKIEKPIEVGLEELIEAGEEPATEIESADNAKLDLHRLLAELDPDTRKLLELKIEGYTFAEIAQKLGLTDLHVAYSRWRRLMAHIEKEREERAARSALVADSAGATFVRKSNARSTRRTARKTEKENNDDHKSHS